MSYRAVAEITLPLKQFDETQLYKGKSFRPE